MIFLKIFILTSLLLPLSIYGKSNSEKAGDIFAFVIPVTAYATTLYIDDKEGEYQFYKSYGLSIATSLTLKELIPSKRPDGSDNKSFPSGHTSSAFSGASFIHFRYGFKYALPAYLGAIFTGYSRVYSDKHHTVDVFAGAIIGTLFSWYFATRYENLKITPNIEKKFKGLTLNYNF